MTVQLRARPIAVITGAAGGMGAACCRLLGRQRRLVLTDIDAVRLEPFVTALTDEGYDVAGSVAGDLCDGAVVNVLANAARTAGPLAALVHTAGLSPSLAAWDAIVRTNVVATALLLDAFDDVPGEGATLVLVASIAGHGLPRDDLRDAAVDAALQPGLLQRLLPFLRTMAGSEDEAALAEAAYAVSERAVIRMAEARASVLGARGRRIVSISPGTIFTAMGRAENDPNPAAARVVNATPMGRCGMAMDIANAVEFLISDAAGFITGTDLRIDGGVIPALGGGAIF